MQVHPDAGFTGVRADAVPCYVSAVPHGSSREPQNWLCAARGSGFVNDRSLPQVPGLPHSAPVEDWVRPAGAAALNRVPPHLATLARFQISASNRRLLTVPNGRAVCGTITAMSICLHSLMTAYDMNYMTVLPEDPGV